MNAKGKIRGDGAQLARYLMTGEKGEIAELVGTRGLEGFGDNPVEAFERLQQLADNNTKSPKPFLHGHIRNAPGEHLTDAQWERALERMEKRLGYEGQPRIVSFHTNLETGDKHLHVAWFRIDLETMKAIDPGMYKNNLKQMCRSLEKEFGLRELSNVRKPDDRARAAGQKEVEEARRLGIDERAVRNAILNCLEAADGGRALRAALDERGLILSNGDKRDCFVVVDHAGGHHALNKKLTGHTLGELRERLADLDRAQLPSVKQAQEIQRTRTAERDRAAGIDRAAQAAMQEAHAEARGKYDSLLEAERKVSRDQVAGRYDDLRAAEPPPEVAREFASGANRAADPAAPVYDRDADNAAWEAKVTEAAISAEAQKARQQPGANAAMETSAYAEEATADRRGGGPEPSGSAQQRPEDMRPASRIESRIADIAKQADRLGATVLEDANGRRVDRVEALADYFRPDGERQTHAVTVHGQEAFAARLEEAGIAIVRVTDTDTKALAALREQEAFDRVSGLAHQPRHFAAGLVAGDLAAVTRQGDVYRINPGNLSDAKRYLDPAAALPGVVETRARFEIEGEKIAALWDQQRTIGAEARQDFAAQRESQAQHAQTVRDVGQFNQEIGEAAHTGVRATGRRLNRAAPYPARDWRCA